MFCPKCRAEFREGFIRCSRCDVDLVDDLPEEPTVHEEESSVDPVKIRFISDHIEAEMIMDLLRQANIPCFIKHREAGEWLSITSGFSVFGEDIYVDKKNAQAALELLNDWDMNKGTGNDQSDEHYDNAPYYKRRRAAARVFSILSVIVGIVVLIYATVTMLRDFISQF